MLLSIELVGNVRPNKEGIETTRDTETRTCNSHSHHETKSVLQTKGGPTVVNIYILCLLPSTELPRNVVTMQQALQ